MIFDYYFLNTIKSIKNKNVNLRFLLLVKNQYLYFNNFFREIKKNFHEKVIEKH